MFTCNTLLDPGKLQNLEDILPSTHVPFQENKLNQIMIAFQFHSLPNDLPNAGVGQFI